MFENSRDEVCTRVAFDQAFLLCRFYCYSIEFLFASVDLASFNSFV